jgi:hypothetical protein
MKKRLMLVFAALLAIPLTDPGHAASDECLAGPNRSPPEGSHWYYRIDRDTHRKCWYLGDQGAKARQAARAKPDRPAKSRAARVQAAPAPSAPQPPATTTLTPQDLAAARWSDPKTSSQAPEETALDGSTTEPAEPVSMASEVPAMPPTPTPAMSAPAAEQAAPAAPPVSSKLMLALIVGALALAAVIGRAIFYHADGSRLIRRDVMDQVAATRGAPLDERLMPIALKAEPPNRHAARRDPAAPLQPQAGDDDLDAILRDLHRAWERVAA